MGSVSGGCLVLPMDEMSDEVSTWDDCDVEIIIGQYEDTHTLQQRRWYRGPILRAISERTGSTPAYLHEYFKILFNPIERVTHDPITGEIIDIHIEGGSTRLLSPEDFSAFLEEVRQWAAENLQMNIPDADPRLRRTPR